MDGRALQVSRADRRLHSARSVARRSPRAVQAATSPTARTREFGFDYLRDNGMATRNEEQVQRGHYFAIVDEVDSILIDEARTPLIISGPAIVSTINSTSSSRWSSSWCASRTCFATGWRAKRRSSSTKGEHRGRRARLHVQGEARASRATKPLLRMMEEPENRKAMDKAELSVLPGSEEERAVRAEGRAVLRHRRESHEADLTEKGRNFLNPNDPDAFVLPDLITRFTRSTSIRDSPTTQKDRSRRPKRQAELRHAGAAHPRHLAIAAGLLPVSRRTCSTSSRKTRSSSSMKTPAA